MKHEWLHRVIVGYRKWPTEQSRFTRPDLVIHKRRPLALEPADGRSISGERIPGVLHNEEKGDRWEEGIRRGGGYNDRKGMERKVQGTSNGVWGKGKERCQIARTRKRKQRRSVSSGVGLGEKGVGFNIWSSSSSFWAC